MVTAAVDSPKALLGPGEAAPYEILEADAPRPVVLACDHASNRVPRALGTLGLAPTHFEQHIAWDIGAGAVTRLLSERLQASAVLGGYSRLVVDLNRDLDDTTAYPAISDGILVPANLSLDVAARATRARALFKPYHEALRRIIQARLREELAPVLVSVHSFTPKLYGVRRPWQIGLLWHKDPRLAVPLLGALRQSGEIVVGDNQPYSGHHPADFTIDHHAEPLGLAHVGVEIRQDLINDVNGQQHWAGILADALESVLASATLYRSMNV
jgi:predicted N-formylglutamate amidohydrolase